MTQTEQRARALVARARHERDSIKDGLIGQVAAMGGGLAGAVIKKYVPQIVPGQAADVIVVLLTDVLIAGLSVWSGSPGFMSFANGTTGFMTGSTAESILP